MRTEYSNFTVILVDNASSDDTVKITGERFPNVTIIKNAENLGYAEGNNIGINFAVANGADYIFILNNDTVIEPGTISTLVQALEIDERVIAASPLSYYYDQPNKIYFAGGKINNKGKTEHQLKIPQGEGAYTTEWLNGCAVMVRTKQLIEVGLFDPSYFLLFEDVDWSLRARKAGFELLVVPDARILHRVSSSFGGPKSPELIYYFTRNYHLWFDKNFPILKRTFFHYYKVKRDFPSIKAFVHFLFGDTPYNAAMRQAYKDYAFKRFFQRDLKVRYK